MSDKKSVKVTIEGDNKVKPGLDGAEKDVKKFGASVKSIVEGLGIAHLLEKIGEKVTEFFKGVAEEGIAAERTQAQLANTLANVGVAYKDVAAEVEDAVGRVARASGQADDEVASALNNMILKSGDYERSLASLPLVADVAAGAQISLAEASDVVGKALAGQTKGLRQFGIVTADARTGLDLLGKRFHGAAETDLSTFGGAMRAATNATKEAQEELGLAIIKTPFFRDAVKGSTKAITEFAEWLETNRAQIGYWASVVVSAVGVVGGTVYDLGVELGAAMGWVVAQVLLQTVRVTNGINEIMAAGYLKLGMYQKAAETYAANTSTAALEAAAASAKGAVDNAAAAMRTRWAEHVDLVQRGSVTAGEAIGHATGAMAGAAAEEAAKAAADRTAKILQEAKQAAEGFLADMKKAHPEWDWGFGTTPIAPRERPAPAPGEQGGLDLGPIDVSGIGEHLPVESALDKVKDKLAGMQPEIMAFADTFSSAFEGIGSGAESMGRGLEKAGKAAIAGLARSEGNLMQAKAAAALAEGFMGNPAAFAAAAEYEVAAAAFFAIGGAVGGSGGHRSGGGGSYQPRDDIGTARVGSASAAASATLGSPRAAIAFTVIGPNDPAAQREIMKLISNAEARGY